jgi:hypothetical protein
MTGVKITGFYHSSLYSGNVAPHSRIRELDSTSNDPERVVSGFMWGLRKVASDFGIVGLRTLPGLTGSN